MHTKNLLRPSFGLAMVFIIQNLEAGAEMRKEVGPNRFAHESKNEGMRKAYSCSLPPPPDTSPLPFGNNMTMIL